MTRRDRSRERAAQTRPEPRHVDRPAWTRRLRGASAALPVLGLAAALVATGILSPWPDAGAEPELLGTAQAAEAVDRPDLDVRSAEETLTAFLRTSDELLTTAPSASNADALRDLATGPVLGGVEAALSEFLATDARQQGRVRVRSLSAGDVDTAQDPPRVSIEACLDSAAIDTVDQFGSSLRAPTAEAPPATLNRYELVHSDGRWLVAGHSFPDDPDC